MLHRPSAARPIGWTLVTLVLILLWDATGFDLPLAQWAGSPTGFGLRGDWFLVQVMHEGAKAVSWMFLVGLVVAVRWPVGFLRRLPMRDRAQLAATVLLSVIVVSLVKTGSTTSCPWDLQVFGGVARHVSHWAIGERDGGPGGCFPAGHASAAFAYLGGYLVLRRGVPRIARIWLAVALGAGFALGVGQQLRGAHYMSHTLWTAWICWTTGLAVELVMQHRRTASLKLNQT